VRRLVQQEDYALRLLHDAGLPSPKSFGVVELTPEREYLLVTEFFGGAVELGEAEVDGRVIDDGLGIVRKLWDAGSGALVLRGEAGVGKSALLAYAADHAVANYRMRVLRGLGVESESELAFAALH